MSRTRKDFLTPPKDIPEIGRVDTLTVGAKKALGEFTKQYGRTEGVRIYLAKADEQGTGNTLRQKVNFIYKKGATIR